MIFKIFVELDELPMMLYDCLCKTLFVEAKTRTPGFPGFLVFYHLFVKNGPR